MPIQCPELKYTDTYEKLACWFREKFISDFPEYQILQHPYFLKNPIQHDTSKINIDQLYQKFSNCKHPLLQIFC